MVLETDHATLADTSDLTVHEADTSTHGVGTIADTADITTHNALDTGVHGSGGDVLATDVDIAIHEADTTSIHGIADTSKLAVIASGNYTGNDTPNRAIVHGLGVVPKYVMFSSSAYILLYMIKPANIHYLHDTSKGARTVTIWDVTNFYVGETGYYAASANNTGTEYYWVAFG